MVYDKKGLEGLVGSWKIADTYVSHLANPEVGPNDYGLRARVGNEWHKENPKLFQSDTYLKKDKDGRRIVDEIDFREGTKHLSDRRGKRLVDYVDTYLDQVISHAKTERLHGLALSLPINENATESFYKETSKLLKELRKMKSYLGDGKEKQPNLGEIRDYIHRTIIKEDKDLLEIYVKTIAASPQRIMEIFSYEIRDKEIELQKKFVHKGKLVKDSVVKYLKLALQNQGKNERYGAYINLAQMALLN